MRLCRASILARLGRAALAVLLLGSAPSSARGWGFDGGQSGVGLRPGLSYPTETDQASLVFNRGYALGLHYFRAPWDWLILGLEGDAIVVPTRYLNFLVQEDAANLITSRVKTRSRTFAALGTARINLVFDKPWTIYVKGGAGIHKTSIQEFFYVVNHRTGESVDFVLGQSDRGLATMAAGGIEGFTNKNVSVALEVRYQEFRLPNKLGANAVEFLTYTLGFNYWFGQR